MPYKIWELCAIERADMLASMKAKELAIFALSLEIPWSHVGMRAAIRHELASALASQLLAECGQRELLEARLDELAACADPCNAACECVPCEKEKAASLGTDGFRSRGIMSGHNLQEVL